MAFDDKIPDAVTRNQHIMRVWMRHWVHNSIGNHKFLQDEESAHSLYETRGIANGRPAIVVGGGASLDDVLDDEERLSKFRRIVNEEKALLLCPNSVVRPMLARGIKPWAFIAMHPTSDIVDGFKLNDDEWMDFEGQRLITCTAIHPAVINRWLGFDDSMERSQKSGDIYLSIHDHADPIMIVEGMDEEKKEATVVKKSSKDSPSDWYGAVQPLMWNSASEIWSEFSWQRRGLNLPSIPNMGCVVNYGVLLSHFLGCETVLTLGNDFSFVQDEEGKMRWRCDDWSLEGGEWIRKTSTAQEDFEKIARLPIREAKGLHGNSIYCHEPMIAYRDAMHFMARPDGILAGSVELVNCSSDGIVTELRRADIIEALEKILEGTWTRQSQS